MRALLVQPRLVAAAGVAGAVERGSGECVVHGACTLPLVGIRLALLTFALALILAAPASVGAAGRDRRSAPVRLRGPRALRALGLRSRARSSPWDAVTSQPDKVDAWLAATVAAGMAPHIAFEHLSSDHCAGSPCVLPSREQYRSRGRRVPGALAAGAHVHGLQRGQPRLAADRAPPRGRRGLLRRVARGVPGPARSSPRTSSTPAATSAGCAASGRPSPATRSCGVSITTPTSPTA